MNYTAVIFFYDTRYKKVE